MRSLTLAAAAALTMCGTAWAGPCGVMLDSEPPQTTPPCPGVIRPAEMPAVSPGPSHDDMGVSPWAGGMGDPGFSVDNPAGHYYGLTHPAASPPFVVDGGHAAATVSGDPHGSVTFDWRLMSACAARGDQLCRMAVAARLDGWRAAGREGEPGEGNPQRGGGDGR